MVRKGSTIAVFLYYKQLETQAFRMKCVIIRYIYIDILAFYGKLSTLSKSGSRHKT